MQEQSRFLLELRKQLIKHWTRYELPGSPSGLAYRMRQLPQRKIIDQNRMVALWFSENPEVPRIATKWFTNKSSYPLIFKEHENATKLYHAHKTPIVPRPLDTLEIDGIPVFLEEAILGRSLAHRLMGVLLEEPIDEKGKNALQSIFFKTEQILNLLQEPLTSTSKNEFFEEFLPIFKKASKFLKWSTSESNKIKATLENNCQESIPGSGKSFLIGDLSPQNLLDGSKGTYLIDLELSHESKIAFLDPISFLYNLFCLTVHGYSRKDESEAVGIFEHYFFSKNSFFSNISNEFLINRHLPNENLPWYWLIFFLNEAAIHSDYDEQETSNKLFAKHIFSLIQRLAGGAILTQS